MSFVVKHHYAGTASAGVTRYGWMLDGEPAGVSIYDTGTRAMRGGRSGAEQYTHVLHHHRLAILPGAPKGTASAFLGACLKQLQKDRPDLWAVVTYADLCQGQDGIVHRATNAVATGLVGKGNLHLVEENGIIRSHSLYPNVA